MPQPSKGALQKNIVKFAWYKVLTKRTYLPIITIYLVEVAHLSVNEIATIALITAMLQLALQLPGGYFADHFGNKKALRYSTWFVTLSPLCYILFPNFWGGLLGSILFFGAYAFQQGSAEAFMHDTMVALKAESQYAKIMGRAQSYGLMGNLILTAIIPITYVIDKRLPFILGFLSLVVMSGLIYSFSFPPHRKQPKGNKQSPIVAMRTVLTLRNAILFLFAGTATAVAIAGPQYQELLFKAESVDPSLFGFIASAGSLLGAIIGMFTHFLANQLSSKAFYLLDATILSASLAIAGYFQNPYAAITAMVIFVGYGRIRLIVIQAKLLADTHAYKATLLSTLSFVTQVIQIAVVTYFGWLVSSMGLADGHLWFGVSVFCVLLILWLTVMSSQRQIKPQGVR